MLSNSGLTIGDVGGSGSGSSDMTDNSRKNRRKLQNRMSQRARRARVQDPDTKDAKKQKRPYQTGRWRLDELEFQKANKNKEYVPTNAETTLNGDSASCSQLPLAVAELRGIDVEVYGERLQLMSVAMREESSKWPKLNIHSDHLLHLINYNVFRGFFANKYTLSKLTKVLLSTGPSRTVRVDIMKNFPGNTIITSPAPNVPPCLIPTPLQTKIPHATWIDLIPFPKMRDNLITRHEQFNHWDFLRDIIGDILEMAIFQEQREKFVPQAVNELVLRTRRNDGLTANRKGLILWGEPYQPEDWEATPGFFEDWGWAAEGCHELIRSTNRWRMARHEAPLQFWAPERATQ